MKYGVYVIRDMLTGYLTPTVDVNDKSAARNFVHAITRTDGIFHSHPQDFDLLRIGNYDSETGVVSDCEHELVAVGLTVSKLQEVRNDEV